MNSLADFLLNNMQPLPLPAKLSNGAAMAIALAVPLLGGFGGSLVTAPEITSWYQRINKPWWTPPGWLFGPVWTALYASMGWASYRVYKALGPADAGRALSVYALQLLLNFCWTPAFFKFHELGAATLVVSLMWLAILGTIAVFSSVLGPASAWSLLGPYLAWTTYAGALTAWIWAHNPPASVGVGGGRAAAAAKRQA